MDVPADLKMNRIALGDGAHGYAFQRSRDAQGLGISCTATRSRWGARWTSEWAHDGLPDRKFATFYELAEALKSLSDDSIASERAKYPRIRSSRTTAERGFSNKCRLCKWNDPDAPRKDGVVRVQLANSWLMEDDDYTELCEDHAHFAEDAKALKQALKNEVAVRRAGAAANGVPW